MSFEYRVHIAAFLFTTVIAKCIDSSTTSFATDVLINTGPRNALTLCKSAGVVIAQGCRGADSSVGVLVS